MPRRGTAELESFASGRATGKGLPHSPCTTCSALRDLNILASLVAWTSRVTRW